MKSGHAVVVALDAILNWQSYEWHRRQASEGGVPLSRAHDEDQLKARKEAERRIDEAIVAIRHEIGL